MAEEEKGVWKGVMHFFNAAFTLEMVTKVLADGLSAYNKDAFNRLDVFLVISTWTEFCVMEIAHGTDSTGAFMALRALRVLRLFRSLRSMEKLRCESHMIIRM
jgi:hypothetical protein